MSEYVDTTFSTLDTSFIRVFALEARIIHSSLIVSWFVLSSLSDLVSST